MGNNSVPKFIFRLSRFPVYRGSVLCRFYFIFNVHIIIAVSLLVSLLMVPRTSVQVQSRSKLMPAMYCITHKIIRLIRLFAQRFPENYSVSALGSFPV